VVIAETAHETLFLDRLEQLRASHPLNRCAQHMSRELFMSFSADQRDELRRCCRSGAENPDSVVGCYIMRPGDLHEFDAFFGGLIRGHHGTSAVAPRPVGQGRDHGQRPDGLDLASLGLPALSTRVRVSRNLQGFPLPGRMDRGERIRLEQSMVRALQVLVDNPVYAGRIFSLTPDFGPDAPNPNLIGGRHYQALVDAHLMFRNMEQDPYMKSAGLAADWPYGRACYISADTSVIVWIGEEDHLRIISLRTGAALAQAYDRLQVVLGAIETVPGVAFVHDSAYGYVASCPSNLGTGLRASVRVTMPNLTRPGVDTKAICRRFGLAACGLGGDHAPIGLDGRIDLSPIRRLFVEDRDILAALFQGLGRVAALART
jgi:hypothetical protein